MLVTTGRGPSSGQDRLGYQHGRRLPRSHVAQAEAPSGARRHVRGVTAPRRLRGVRRHLPLQQRRP
eukprot:11159-Ditylum_brightwellii.AAC.1